MGPSAEPTAGAEEPALVQPPAPVDEPARNGPAEAEIEVGGLLPDAAETAADTAAEAQRSSSGAPLPEPPFDPVADDLLVAHVLLRSGNALPARVQLETLAGRRQLDADGLLDLAESRWRTGDLAGASEAATAYLEAGGDGPLAYLIAAESTSANGRPGEARRFARLALEGLSLPLDAVFSGQPRSSIWPHDPAQPVQPAGTLFAAAGVDAAHGGRIGLIAATPTAAHGWAARPAAALSPADPSASDRSGPPADGDEASDPDAAAGLEPEHGLWDAPDAPLPDVQDELNEARAAVAAGDVRTATTHLSIVLRLSPALAPAVLDLVGALPGPEYDLLRGDALRLVGREAAAERAYAAAAEALRNQSITRSLE